MPLILFSQLKSVEMAQKQNCCVSDMGQMIPQIRSTTTTKTKTKTIKLHSYTLRILTYVIKYLMTISKTYILYGNYLLLSNVLFLACSTEDCSSSGSICRSVVLALLCLVWHILVYTQGSIPRTINIHHGSVIDILTLPLL